MKMKAAIDREQAITKLCEAAEAAAMDLMEEVKSYSDGHYMMSSPKRKAYIASALREAVKGVRGE